MNHGKKSLCIGQFRNLKHFEYKSNFRQNLRGGEVALYMKKESNMFQDMT